MAEAKGFNMLFIYSYLFKSFKYLETYFSKYISHIEKASFHLFYVPLMCSAIITTLQIKGTLYTTTFYDSDKTKS